MQMRMAEEMALQKSTWKWAVRMPSVVFTISSICRMATPKRMPLIDVYKRQEENFVINAVDITVADYEAIAVTTAKGVCPALPGTCLLYTSRWV